MSKTLKRSKCFISLLIVTVMILSMSIPAMCAQAVSMTDIDNHWAKNEISAWVEQGFIEGYPDNTFKPNNTITRAEFIKLVNRLFAFNEKGAVTFTDVKETDWFYADFAKASKAGYLSGYEGKVEPNVAITRQEVATIAAKVKSLKEDAAEADNYADAAAIPAGSKGFIGAVAKFKIMNGYPGEKFEPAKGITRAESVIVLNRLMSLKDTVKIEAIKDKTVSVGYTTTAVVKTLTADATISAKSSDDNVVQATVSGLNIYLKGIKEGTATITVTGKKNGMPDGVITFKVDVTKATATSGGGGGGGGGGHSGGGTNPPVDTDDDNNLTKVQAIVGTSTIVTGKYASGVTKIEVIYNGITKPAALANGSFQCSITPSLAIGAKITVKGYAGTRLVDTDAITVIENDSKLTALKAIGTVATEVTGKYAEDVSKVEVICGGTTYEAVLNPDGTFFRKLVGLQNGTLIVAKAYINGIVVDTDEVTLGGAPVDKEAYITDLKAIGTVATEVTGKYTGGVEKVEVICGGTTYEAVLNPDGTFFRKLVGLQNGTLIVAKAYIDGTVVDTDEVTLGGAPVEEDLLSNVKAVQGVMFVKVTGNHAAGVDTLEVSFNGETVPARKNGDGTFYANIVSMNPITEVTVKAYVANVLKDTVKVNVQ